MGRLKNYIKARLASNEKDREEVYTKSTIEMV